MNESVNQIPQNPHQVNLAEGNMEVIGNKATEATVEGTEITPESDQEVIRRRSLEEMREEAGSLKVEVDKFSDDVGRLATWVRNRAPYGGFGIGEKIESSDEFRQLRALEAEFPDGVRRFESLVSQMGDTDPDSAEYHAKFASLGKLLEAFDSAVVEGKSDSEGLYGGVIRMGRQIREFYDGQESEDEEFVQTITPILRDIHDTSRRMKGVVDRCIPKFQILRSQM
jgi:hypothetical protein